jgi:polyphenol oxidase
LNPYNEKAKVKNMIIQSTHSQDNLYYHDLESQHCYIIPIIRAQWLAPSHINAFSTLSYYFSQDLKNNQVDGPILKNSFNLGFHTCVNDQDRQNVAFNRAILEKALAQPLYYFKQTHSPICHDLDLLLSQSSIIQDEIEGDASLSSQHACLAMTADCLPIFVTDRSGSFYSVIHAGWRGIANDVIRQSILQFLKKSNQKASDLFIHLAPAIGQHAFEVGQDLIEIFIKKDANIYKNHFKKIFTPIQTPTGFDLETSSPAKFLANIYQMAYLELLQMGILAKHITQNEACTFFDQRFFSYRRSEMLKNKAHHLDLHEFIQPQNGRMAHIIY